MKRNAFDEVDRLHDELVQQVETSKVFLKFLEKKIALEEEYATQVRQLCKSQPSLGSSGTAGSFSALVGLVCEHASTTLSNLSNFSLDTVVPFKAALLQMKNDMQEAHTEGKKLQQERKKSYDNYKKAKFIYEAIAHEQADKSTVLAESDYKFHISVVNKNQASYFREHLPKISKQYQTTEIFLTTKTQETVQKYFHVLNDTATRCNESLKATTDKLSKPALSGTNDIDKYRKFCDELIQTPPDYLFGQEPGEKTDSSGGSPHFSTMRNKFLKTGRSAVRISQAQSVKWRNSLSVLTSPNREAKKVKRQSMPVQPTHLSLFGTPLHLLLEQQKKSHPTLDVPFVAFYLVNHFKKIGGLQTENVFRVPGMTVEVQNIKAALEAGKFTEDLLACSVHSAASAFTMWLRELPSPLIPYYMHAQCIGAKTQEELLKIFYSLPRAHVSTLIFLLGLIQELAKTENQVKTRMNADNLSMVFTPSILHAQNPIDVLTNIEKERQFVKSAIDATDILMETFPIRLQVQSEE